MKFKSPLVVAGRLRHAYYKKRQSARTEKLLGLDVKDRFSYPEDTVGSEQNRVYSIVSAVYRAEKYLDELLGSLVRQRLDFKKHIQVILVDDGSDDGSGVICKEWVARFPDNIKYLYKENGGQGSARNFGLPHATGDWIGFVDPDDILDRNYLLEVDRALDQEADVGDISFISCHYMMYYEEKCKVEDRHPLAGLHAHGLRRVVFDQHCDVIQLSTSVALFSGEMIRKEKIRFRDTGATGEDAEFVARFLLGQIKPQALLVPSAHYYYRKRATRDSSVDTAWSKSHKYDTQLRMYLDLANEAISRKGAVPRWLQRMFAYDLGWHFNYFLNNHQRVTQIPGEMKDKYIELLGDLLNLVDPDELIEFDLGRMGDLYRLSMLALGHPYINHASTVNIFQWDDSQKLFCCRYYYIGSRPKFDVQIGGRSVRSVADKVREHRFLGKILVREYIGWFPWPGHGMVSFFINDEFVVRPTARRSKDVIVQRLRPPSNPPAKLGMPARVYRWLSQLPSFANRFRDAWLLMDRDTQADDNAEHLYRYIGLNQRQINAWFVLREESHDWARLKRDGFRLLAYGSLAHKMALINAKHVISSHADDYVINFLPKRNYRDLMRWNYTFLQHGVTKDDLSEWLNRKPIRHFITAARVEYESVCMGESGYKFTPREVALTGFPRHDRLMSLDSLSESRKRILIMPTWRQSIVGGIVGKGNERARNQEFRETEYYKYWRGLLSDSRLHDLVRDHDMDLVFFPHANLSPYLEDFRFEGVTVLGHRDVNSIQDLFISAAMLITDYSSVAFEMAYLKRPIVYYQFDEDLVFGGGHLTQKGYFDYRRHGFGPVCVDREALLEAVNSVLIDGVRASAPYAQRMDDFFACRDGRCCERVFNLIEEGELEPSQ